MVLYERMSLEKLITAGVMVGEDHDGNKFYSLSHSESIGWKTREAHGDPRLEAGGRGPQLVDSGTNDFSVTISPNEINALVLNSEGVSDKPSNESGDEDVNDDLVWGEKIGGSRLDTAMDRIGIDDLADLDEREIAVTAVKAKLWPTPDYKEADL